MKFAKLFDLENDEQVLLDMSYDNDTEKDIVEVITDIVLARASVKYSFKETDSAIKFFETFDIESAKKFRIVMEADFS